MALYSLTVTSGDVAATLTDYPAYIDLSEMPASFWSTVTSDGGDIRMYSDEATTTELAREVYEVDTVGQTGEVHVKIPSLTTSTVIYLEVDGTSTEPAATATYGRNNVWTDYEVVLHLGESTGSPLDSTGNGNGGTYEDSLPTTQAGKVGEGQDLDGTNDYIELPNASTLLSNSTDHTINVWAKWDTTSGNEQAWYVPRDTNSTYGRLGMSIDYDADTSPDRIRFRTHDGVIREYTALSGVSTATWYKITVTYDASATSNEVYVDAANNASPNDGTPTWPVAAPLQVGASVRSSLYTDGGLDEFRIRNDAVSANWETTEYNNQSDAAGFWTIAEIGSADYNLTAENAEFQLTFGDADIDTPPTGLTIDNVTEHSMRLSWTKGASKTRTLVVMKEGSAPTSSTDGVKVYNDTGTSVTVNHLTPSTTYYFALYDNLESYSLGTESTKALGGVPVGMAVTDQYIFIGLQSGDGIEVLSRDDPTTIVATIAPANLSTNTIERVDAKGNYLAFAAGDYLWLYEFVDENDYTQLREENVGDGALRSVHIDTEQEYVYTGNQSGDLVFYDIATWTKNTFALAAEVVRDIDTDGDLLVAASNDNKAYAVDRSTRTSLSKSTIVTESVNVEVTRIDDDYIYIGSDTTNVEVRNKTSPYAVQFTLTDAGNDITSASAKDPDYLSVSSDDENVRIYDKNDSFAVESTISSPTAFAENSWIQDGDLYYIAGDDATTPTQTLYYRSYLSNSLGTSPLQGNQTTLGDTRNVLFSFGGI